MTQAFELADFLDMDRGATDALTPRDAFRAMCIARAMGEGGMAEKLRLALLCAVTAAGLDLACLAPNTTATVN